MQTKHTFLGKMRNYHIIYIVTHKRREYNMSATSDITLRKINLNDIEDISKIDIENIDRNYLLQQIETEIQTINSVDKKNWIKIYERMKLIIDKELWVYHSQATSFSSWVRYFSLQSKIHQTILWNRYRAGQVYANYCKYKEDKGETAVKLDKLNISPDSLVLLEKINKHAPAMATKITEDVLKGKLKRKELTVMYEALRSKKPDYTKCKKIDHMTIDEEGTEDENERNMNTIKAAEILATLSTMRWVGKTENNGFKGSINQEGQEEKIEKDKAYAIAEFPVFTVTSKKSRRIDMLGIENITKEYYEKKEVNLHGIEIKVSANDLKRDIKFYEYEEFVDFMWLAIPEGLVDIARELKSNECGIITINNLGDVVIVEQAKRLEPPLRHKTLEVALLSVL